MKLYAWIPWREGPLSFFVAAESEEEAEMAVAKYIASLKEERYRTYIQKVWGTDMYTLHVLEPGEVIDNENA